MQMLGLLGIYFDAAIVSVTNSSLLFRFALAILFDAISSFYFSVRATILDCFSFLEMLTQFLFNCCIEQELYQHFYKKEGFYRPRSHFEKIPREIKAV